MNLQLWMVEWRNSSGGDRIFIDFQGEWWEGEGSRLVDHDSALFDFIAYSWRGE